MVKLFTDAWMMLSRGTLWSTPAASVVIVGNDCYLRPNGIDTYLRPGGVDTYLRN